MAKPGCTAAMAQECTHLCQSVLPCVLLGEHHLYQARSSSEQARHTLVHIIILLRAGSTSASVLPLAGNHPAAAAYLCHTAQHDSRNADAALRVGVRGASRHSTYRPIARQEVVVLVGGPGARTAVGEVQPGRNHDSPLNTIELSLRHAPRIPWSTHVQELSSAR